MIGINVFSTEDEPFADLIVDGKKTIETRTVKSLHPYIGKRVAIIRTGMGKAQAIGEVTITGATWTDNVDDFRSASSEHLVHKDSKFFINPEHGKWLYYLDGATRYDTPKAVTTFGIVARQL